MTISEISSKIGMSRQSLYNMMEGKTEPNLKNLTKLSTALEIPLIEFFREKQYFSPSDSFRKVEEKNSDYGKHDELINAKNEQIQQLEAQIKFLQHIIEEKM